VDIVTVLLAILFAALTAYALLGGADFGGGFWDLFARSKAEREVINHAMGPVWEANHVWLIFTTVLLWTGFPSVFAAIASTMYIPLTAAALGIIGRGAGFAFRKTAGSRLFGLVFTASSIVTPFFLGAVLGGIASGRVPAGIARGDVITAWWNPTSIATGILAVGVCAYLAAIFLQHEAPAFRDRALSAGLVVGGLAAVCLLVVLTDNPLLRAEFGHPLPIILASVSAASGVVSLFLVYWRSPVAARPVAGLAAASVLWAWGAAQYPYLLPGPPSVSVTVADAAATPAVIDAMLLTVGVGAVVLVPSLWLLFRLFATTSGK
jgi:cytochrome d ubiquinol oxidase subunit II